METPLLVNGGSSSEVRFLGADGDYRALKGLREWSLVFWIETVKLWRIAFPIAMTTVCQFGTTTLTTISVGHLGDLQLSAVSLSTSVICTFSFGFLMGMGSALETLCGQAFGAGQVHMLGVYMQRSWIILFVSCILISPIYIFATPILKFLGQQEDLAVAAGSFTIQTLPQLFSLAITFPTGKFLQAQSKVKVYALISVLSLFVQSGLLWLFIYAFSWGVAGAAVAMNITSWVIVVFQLVYIFIWCTDGWNGFTWAAFNDLWAFVRLSLASAVMLCLEIWYMMSISILTGHLNNAVLAVGSLTICMNINGLQAMVFIGINAAISVRVSNELGMGRPRGTKYSLYVTVLQCFIVGLLCMVIVLIFRDRLGSIFSSSQDMLKAVSKLAYLLGITMVINSVQLVISGVAIGGGWQALVAYINLGCYYVFGLPLGILLGYKANLGVQGLWGGMICGAVMQTLLLLIVLYKTNWNKEVDETSKRMRKWGGQDIPIEKL